ncbi:hypothetical protein D3C76_1582320 [compost metagenome]
MLPRGSAIRFCKASSTRLNRAVSTLPGTTKLPQMTGLRTSISMASRSSFAASAWSAVIWVSSAFNAKALMAGISSR